jgi:O-antigen/teichoic acid export membrane protein
MKKNFLSNIALTLIAIILNFSFKIYLANLISKNDLGIYYTMIDIISLFLIVFIGSRSSMVVYYNQTKDDTTILNLFRYSIFAVTIFSLAVILPFAKDFLNISIPYLFFALLLISQAIYTYFYNQLGVYRMYKETNTITLLEAILIIGLFFVLNSFFDYFESLIVATTLNFVILSLYILWKKPYKEPKISKIELNLQTREFISNSFVASLEFALGMLSVYISVIFFTKYFTLSDLADFQVVVKSIYFYFLILFVFPIFKFVFPELSNLISKNEINEIQKLQEWIWKYSLIVTALSACLTFIFAFFGIEHLFGKEYLNSSQMLIPLVLVFFFVLQNGFLTSLIKGFNGFKTTFTIRFIGIVVFIMSFYVLQLFESNPINVIYAFLIGHLITYALLKTKAKGLI